MKSYRGEAKASHPQFPDGSGAACAEEQDPVQGGVVHDIVYTAQDDEAIDAFHRKTSEHFCVRRVS